MQKLKFPMMISDFDGTLVNNDGTISHMNKNAIAKYRNDGGIFVISTGRMHYGILPRAKELGLKGLVSCCQGAIIMDIETQKTLSEGTISNKTTVQVCEKMEELGLHIHVYGKDAYYTNMDDERLKIYEDAVRFKAVRVLDRPMSQFVKETGLCSYKIMALVASEKCLNVIRFLSQYTFDGCTLTKSDETLVEVINASYSKGTALEFLANHFQIPTTNVIAVGDQWNDVPMIEKAGLGFAVKNADNKLKEKAIALDYTNEEGAVAKIIEKYVYAEE